MRMSDWDGEKGKVGGEGRRVGVELRSSRIGLRHA